jgi:hypothetical protein
MVTEYEICKVIGMISIVSYRILKSVALRISAMQINLLLKIGTVFGELLVVDRMGLLLVDIN